MSRRPEELPPIFRATQTSKPLFVNPREWAAERIKAAGQKEELFGQSASISTEAAETVKRGRGRPTNLSRLQARIGGEAC